jgi:hypothetical protein
MTCKVARPHARCSELRETRPIEEPAGAGARPRLSVSPLRPALSIQLHLVARDTRNGTAGAASSAKAAKVLNERHPEWRLARKALAKAREEGRLLGETVDELEAELANCACGEGGCARRAPGRLGYCSRHVRGALSRGKPRPKSVRRAISRTKRENPHQFTPEQRGKMRAAKGHRSAKLRYCKCGCGEPLLRDDPALEDVPLEVLEQYGLIDERRDFFSRSCHIAWAWLHDRGRFPQGCGSPIAFPCDLGCGRTVLKHPAQIAIREGRRYRFLCDVHAPIYRRYRLSAEQRARDAAPRAGTPSEATLAALERVWEAADQFQAEIFKHWPKRRGGKRQPLASDLFIVALHRRRPTPFTDEQVADLLNRSLADRRTIPGVRGTVDADYVEQRRRRRHIYRIRQEAA